MSVVTLEMDNTYSKKKHRNGNTGIIEFTLPNSVQYLVPNDLEEKNKVHQSDPPAGATKA